MQVCILMKGSQRSGRIECCVCICDYESSSHCTSLYIGSSLWGEASYWNCQPTGTAGDTHRGERSVYNMLHYIHIYAFGRCFNPKWLTLHSSYIVLHNKTFDSYLSVCWSFWLFSLHWLVCFPLLIFLVTSAPPEILEGKSHILWLLVSSSVDPSYLRVAVDILVSVCD